MKKLTTATIILSLTAVCNVSANETLGQLSDIFTDRACTELTGRYAAMSDTELHADRAYKALPYPIRLSVDKIRKGDWSEPAGDTSRASDWDDIHARKYRVQIIEPYSEGEAAATMMACRPHTNLNNPTGLVTSAGTTLYIMVEGEIKDGAELYFGEISGALTPDNMYASNTMPTVRANGIKLHEGMNTIVTRRDNAASYLYYTVSTCSGNQRVNRLSDYPDLKIHIEGGTLNGFFNYTGDELYTPDTREDLQYCLARASHPDFAMIGRSFINIVPLDSRFSNGSGGYYPALRQIADASYDPIPVMTRWDDIVSIIQTNAGLKSADEIKAGKWADYYQGLDDPEQCSEYFNNRLLNIIMENVPGVAMWSTAWYNGCCAYTTEEVIRTIGSATAAETLWGPAHEYGHTLQDPINIAGATEISNNLHANTVVYLLSDATSRTEYISDLRKLFNDGRPWVEGRYWTATRMYFQLWLYYHRLGHNKQFLPKLHEIMRRDMPSHNKATDYLKFARAVCEASGEDLTDFFEAWGFFVPLNDYHIEDYGDIYLNLTKSEIAAFKEEIASLGLPVNRQILFIDDRIGSTRRSYTGFPKEKAGDLGGIDDFANRSRSDGGYRYTNSGTEMSIEGGKGGVGFIIYDNDGTLLSFANTYKFTLSRRAASALVSGTAKVYSVDADGTLGEIEPAESDETVRTSLQQLIANAREMLANTSTGDKRVGCYISSYLQDIKQLTDKATEYIDRQAATAELRSAYAALSEAIIRVESNPYSRKRITAGSTYHLVNLGYPDLALAVASSAPAAVSPSISSDAQQWVLEPTGASDSYYIRSKSTGLYMQKAASLSVPFTLGQNKCSFKAATAADGSVSLTETDNSYNSLHIDGYGKVVAWWDTDNTHSRWIMTETASDPLADLRNELEKLLYDADQEIEKAGVVDAVQNPVALTAASFFTNAKCTVPGSDMFTSWSVLIDNNVNTYFHSNWAGADSDDGLDHYIGIDLGAGNSLTEFMFGYTTRGSDNLCAPRNIIISASNDGRSWTPVTVIDSHLPASHGESYLSDPIMLKEPYRYLRFMVTSTTSGSEAGGHQVFALSEFRLATPIYDPQPSAEYPDMTSELLLDAYAAAAIGRQTLTSATSADEIKQATERLSASLAALRAAMTTTGIGLTPAEQPLPSPARGIYDMSGRRIGSITSPGVYIVDGKKKAATEI